MHERIRVFLFIRCSERDMDVPTGLLGKFTQAPRCE